MTTNRKKSIVSFADAALVLVAFVWGTGFIATEYAIQAQMSASLIMSIRFVIAALVMLPFCAGKLGQLDKKTVLHGSVAGVILFLSFYLQTVGQASTNVSSSAFLTATNVVMVPFIVWAITRQRPTIKTFLLAATTLVGIGILTIKPSVGLSFSTGDSTILICAFCFALHITYLGIFCKGLNARLLTLMQLATAGVISVVVLVTFDLGQVTMTSLSKGILPTLYLALFSTCLCYFLQTAAQQHTTPGKAGIILCMEGLFGTLCSVIVGLEPITLRILAGGLVILLSVIATEVDFGKMRKRAVIKTAMNEDAAKR